MAQKEYYLIHTNAFKNEKVRVKMEHIDVENLITYLHIAGIDDAYCEVDKDQGMH